ncbi:MAG: hypothetical protein HY037_02450 [Nitrospirae bacterium]|nr:hypothetical protein [Candidatus Troglogloeales bacterium]
MTIRWIEGAGTTYNLYMAEAAGVTKENVGTLAGGMEHKPVTSPFVHANLQNGTQYFFVLTAVTADGESQESNEVSATATSTVANPKAIAAGDAHTCAILASGSVKCWNNNNDTPTATSTAITAGGRHTCAILLPDNSVQCWGDNNFGQLGDGTVIATSTPMAIAAGDAHTCAILTDGSVKCWGNNEDGQLGNGAIITGDPSSTSTPVSVIGIGTAITITAGEAHTCAILTDGSVKCWGSNNLGQLGVDVINTVATSTPALVPGITAKAITAGGRHTCAILLLDNTVKCWGDNNFGQLGDGTFNATSNPVSIGIATSTAITAGLGHTCALLLGKSVQCWGFNASGQLGNDRFTNSNIPVTVIGVTDATAIDAGLAHTCAILESGIITCWGDNTNDQLGISSNIFDKSSVLVQVQVSGIP